MFFRRGFMGGAATVALGLLTSALLSGCGGCDDIFSTKSCDFNAAPVVSGQVDVSGSTGNSIAATWTAATDDKTPAANLQYQVMYSTSNNISTVADALANGTVGTAWTSNITSSSLTGLSYATTYYVAVLVQDQASLKSIYPVASRLTATQLVLSNGGQVTCPAGTVMNGFGGRKGGIVDQLFLQCAPDSAPTQASATQGPGIGGNGGTAFSSFYCPDGSYVNGVSGGNGWPTYPTALASFKVTCSDNSATQSNVSYSVQGTTAYQYTCPAGQKAIGVDAGATTGGAYAGFVNGIICQ